jgi:hypothetical protein
MSRHNYFDWSEINEGGFWQFVYRQDAGVAVRRIAVLLCAIHLQSFSR